jgi:hypothetical protein
MEIWYPTIEMERWFDSDAIRKSLSKSRSTFKLLELILMSKQEKTLIKRHRLLILRHTGLDLEKMSTDWT